MTAMFERNKYERVSELYEGEGVVFAVLQFDEPTDFRSYRLQPVVNPETSEWTVRIEQEKSLSFAAETLHFWSPIVIPGIFEGRTREEALHHALAALNETASGQRHDHEGPGYFKLQQPD